MENRELEKRLSLLEKKATFDQKQKEKDAQRNLAECNELMNKIHSLQPRIAELIALADKCVLLGIRFPSKYETYKYGFDASHPRNFEADGIQHCLGFFNLRHGKTYLAILNGGYNGPIDFLTDGTTVTGRSNRSYDNGTFCSARKEDMEKFINGFDYFESAFLKWIDSLTVLDDESSPKVSESMDFERFAVAIINEFESGLEEDGRSAIANSMRHIFTKYQQNNEREIISDVLIALTGYGTVSLLELSKEVDLSD